MLHIWLNWLHYEKHHKHQKKFCCCVMFWIMILRSWTKKLRQKVWFHNWWKFKVRILHVTMFSFVFMYFFHNLFSKLMIFSILDVLILCFGIIKCNSDLTFSVKFLLLLLFWFCAKDEFSEWRKVKQKFFVIWIRKIWKESPTNKLE